MTPATPTAGSSSPDDDAIPALVKLLDDATIVDWQPSGYMYWIKDFGAFYLGRITGKPIPFHEDLAARDREITLLRGHAAQARQVTAAA